MKLKRALRSTFPRGYRLLGRLKRLLDVAGPREQRRRLAAAVAATDAFPAVGERKRHGLATPLVVSLTSYPKRYATLARTLRSLMDQTVRPDHLVLWLAAPDRASLPADVLALVEHGLEIRACADLRSAKKLLPALAAFPDATIVTTDDDVYYEPLWLERLVDAARDHPRAVIGYRGHVAQFDAGGQPAAYEDWAFDTDATGDLGPGRLLFLTGVSGILYPPGALHEDVLDAESYLALCPRADDIWFFAMAVRQGTARRRVAHRLPVVEWPASQESALNSYNFHESGNDAQFAALLERFPELRPALRS
ncbi:glycosyltransferase [Sphingomonas sp. RHCKR7]|uniref:glycosyltransferase n=1 Tax=Sphingomonas folli TaxID=2862497 RepID=UPI001CA52E6C|nr:glycosyltransferase [Sphingomonas folli]MBW6528256.1 glycosyltransferase [Sphingomonas folli]